MQISWLWGGLGSALLHGALGALLIHPVAAPVEGPVVPRADHEFSLDLELSGGGHGVDPAPPLPSPEPPRSVRLRVPQGKALPLPRNRPPVATDTPPQGEASAAPSSSPEASAEVSSQEQPTSGPASEPAPSALPAGGEGKGAGAPRGKVSPGYAAMLDGWFSSRVALGGLDLPWEELSRLRVRVSISIGSDRRVSGFSLQQGSGHGAYDARIEAALRAVVASGVQLPPPPEGEEVPGHLALVFRCRSQERCS
ncbi:MAG: TonB C-terminal domain-containing protein [Polyangiaceae bacterium]|jgi:hypothetical protein|nr:TonB C-terminal domain-containing protein [Polyangiaceae bacterium]